MLGGQHGGEPVQHPPGDGLRQRRQALPTAPAAPGWPALQASRCAPSRPVRRRKSGQRSTAREARCTADTGVCHPLASRPATSPGLGSSRPAEPHGCALLPAQIRQVPAGPWPCSRSRTPTRRWLRSTCCRHSPHRRAHVLLLPPRRGTSPVSSTPRAEGAQHPIIGVGPRSVIRVTSPSLSTRAPTRHQPWTRTSTSRQRPGFAVASFTSNATASSQAAEGHDGPDELRGTGRAGGGPSG
jgi:hypothetical protein